MYPHAAATFSVLNISLSLDIIGRVAFGHDFGSGESSEAKAMSDSWHQDAVLGMCYYLCANDMVLITPTFLGRTFAGFLAPILIGAFPWINNLPIPALQAE